DTVLRRLVLGEEPDGASGAAPAAETGEEKTGGSMQESKGAAAPHQMGRALFAASFDPLTNGHLDLIHRARATFPELVVAVARNVAKQGTFTVDERLEILHAVLDGQPGIRISAFDGL